MRTINYAEPTNLPMGETEDIELVVTETRKIRMKLQLSIPENLQGKTMDHLSYTWGEFAVGTKTELGLDIDGCDVRIETDDGYIRSGQHNHALTAEIKRRLLAAELGGEAALNSRKRSYDLIPAPKKVA